MIGTFLVLLAAAFSNAALQERQVQLKTIAGEKTVVRDGVAVRKVPAASADAQIHSNEYLVARWAAKLGAAAEPAWRTLAELEAQGPWTFAKLMIAMAEMHSLAAAIGR